MSVCDWPCWSRRSLLMRAGVITMTTGVLCHIVAIATPFWITWPSDGLTSGHVGLFSALYKDIPGPDKPTSLLFLLLSCASLIVASSMLMANVGCLHTKFVMVLPALVTFYFIAGLLQMIPLTILMMSQIHLVAKITWSTWLATAVVFLYFISSGLCTFEYMKRRDVFYIPRLTNPLEEEGLVADRQRRGNNVRRTLDNDIVSSEGRAIEETEHETEV